MPNDGEVLAELGAIRKTDTELIKLEIYRHRKRLFVDMRIWYTAMGGEMKPSQKGIRLRASLIPAMIKGLQAAYRYTSVSHIVPQDDERKEATPD